MRNVSIQYIMILLAVLFAGRSVTHLVRLGGWQSLAFTALKDAIVAALVIYYLRVSRTAHRAGERESTNMAVLSMQALLLISIVSDVALSALK